MTSHRYALVVVLLAFAAPALGQPAPRPISLQEAVELSQRNAPRVVQARGQERTTAAAVRAAYGSFVPSLSLSAGATRQLPSAGARTRVENGQIVNLPAQPWSSNVGLSANVQLFDGGQRFFDLRQAQARADIAEGNLVTQRYGASLDVKQSYFDVLAARESEAAALAQVQQAEQQFRSAMARVAARSATLSDSLRAEIQLRSARLALVEARTSIQVAEASLTRAVGSEEPVTAEPASALEPPRIALSEKVLAQLASEGPDVQQASAALDASRSARRSAWTDYLPSLSASYSRNGSGTDDTFWADRLSYSGALRFSVSMPLFDQLRREEQVVQAKVAEQNAAADLRDARLAAQESFARYYGAFRTAEERVTSQAATVASAEEDLRVQQQRYNLGGSTILDVLTSQAQLDQARRDLIRARYDQRVAKAQLEALVGRDL